MEIVIVDDEIGQCLGLEKAVGILFPGISVKTFVEVLPAWDYIRKHKIKIVITDIRMREISGLEFAEMILGWDIKTKVILLTGYAEFGYAKRAIGIGAFDYLLKPVDLDELQDVINRAWEIVKKQEKETCQNEKARNRLGRMEIEKMLNGWVCGNLAEGERLKIRQIVPQGLPGFLVITRLYGIERWKNEMGQEGFDEFKISLLLFMKETIGKKSLYCGSYWYC